jgi:hypothetical protein
MVKCVKELSLVALCVAGIYSCTTQSKDVAIKEDITSKAKESIDFVGVNYIVDKGTVILSGLAPTPDAKQRAEQTVKGIAGVKDVTNNIAIGAIVLDTDFSLKQKVDSVLKKYNKAQALVEDSNVVLLGEVSKEAVPKIMKAMDQLPVNMVDNQMQTE